MFLSLEETIIIMAGQSEEQIKGEEEYREYLCKDVYKNKECGFSVRAKSEGEVMEHAQKHQEEAHGMKERTPEAENRMRENIRSVPMAQSNEYSCTEPGCRFSVRSNSEDEIIERSRMHQNLSHNINESVPEARSRVQGRIRRVSIPIS